MAKDVTQNPDALSPEVDKEQLRALIAQELSGTDVAGLQLLISDDGLRIILPQSLDFSRLVLIDDHIALIQPDGQVVVLLGAGEHNFILQIEGSDAAAPSLRVAELSHPEAAWEEIGEVPQITLPNEISLFAVGGAGASKQVLVNDPLIGLPIHPLLPFTEYPWRQDHWEWIRGGAGPADIHIDPLDPDAEAVITLQETDAAVAFRIADYYRFSSLIGEDAARFTTITIELNGLPQGTTVSVGTLSLQTDGTLRLSFSGPMSEFQSLIVSLPTDFSTDSRIDAPTGILQGSIRAVSELGDDVEAPLTIKLGVEADIEMNGPGLIELAETDGPVDFRPADALMPGATDIDGSERIAGVSLTMNDLPEGTLISYDGGRSFDPIDGTIDFSGSLDEYAAIVLRLPTDFSTQNPPSSLTGWVSATTNEGGFIEDSFDVSLTYEFDVDLSAPAVLISAEDSLAGDGSGVELFLGIRVTPTDDDGSEDSTRVEITYHDAPKGISFSTGTYDPVTGIWTGSITQAESLTMIVPGDYSGKITSTIRAISPEGETQTEQRVEIAPRGDIDFDVSNVIRTETDAPIVIDASSVWKVSISDQDPNLPLEMLENVTLVLNGVPAAVAGSPGISWLGVPDSTIDYDPATGLLTFSGTGAQYADLKLVFPKDFSTQSRSDGIAAGPITGTISAISSEDDAGGQEIPFDIVIRDEGDVAITVRPVPDLVEDQNDPGDPSAPYSILPSDMLAPRATDIDGSESVRQLVLVVRGLPATDENGVPLTDPIDGSYLGLQVDPDANVSFARAADGSVTMTITLNASAVGDVVAAYNDISFSVPADFSTANRSDLLNGDTSLPLNFDLTARTSEEDHATNDPDASGRDGLAQESYVLNIDYVEDIDLDAPARLRQAEDGGPDSQTGTFIDLGIQVAIGDIDQSETEGDPATDIFAAVVTVRFSAGLPNGSAFVDNLDPSLANAIGSYDPDTRTWTGTVAEANALVVQVPPNRNGTVTTEITVTTREGSETVSQIITITPESDVVIDGEVLADETDTPLVVDVSSFVTALDLDADETLVTLEFELPGLPAGTLLVDLSGNPVGTLSPQPDGTLTLSYIYDGTGTPPDEVRIIFSQDYSTESPLVDLVANLTIVTEDNGIINAPVSAEVPFTIHDEGDPLVPDSTMTISETDATLTFKPSDTGLGGILPSVTDIDGSETITSVSVDFSNFPAGARYAITDGVPTGADFLAIPSGGLIGLSLEDYQNLTIRLPQDFSTESPTNGPLQVRVTAVTDEGDANTNTDTGTLTINVTPEGDLPEVDDVTQTLAENDPVSPTILDDDTTGSEPIEFMLAESLTAPAPTDVDGSETLVIVRISISGLPSGALISFDDAVTFEPIADGIRDLTPEQFDAMVVRLPDDFSTGDTDITGSVTFITDEDQDNNQDTPSDGQAVSDFTITVTPEADIAITTNDVTNAEDFVGPLASDPNATIALNLDVQVTDQDGSETLQTVTVRFDGLPPGGAVLSDGTGIDITITPADNSVEFTGTSADIARLQALAIASLPPHYSGRIVVTIEAQSDEGGVVSESFNVDIAPVAEPVITLSVSGATVSDGGVDGIPDNAVVKEDSSFILGFNALTPDNADGSEVLTQIALNNIPVGWAGADGADVMDLLTGETGKIASATVSGTSIIITLVAGVTSVDAGITLTPLHNDDRDVETLTGADITATVTSVDSADSVPATDTATASDSVDVDVDAVVDPASGDTVGAIVNENIDGQRVIRLNANNIALTDTDGSETITEIEMTISVDTASDDFDAARDMELFVDPTYAGFISITETDNGDGTVSYVIAPTSGTSQADFQLALDDLQLSFPQHFSGVASVDGTLSWTETRTGDVETDISDNPAEGPFSTTLTVQAVAEAALDASVFVLNAEEVSDATTRIDASVKDGSVTRDEILTLLESTADGSSDAGQVHLFVGLAASTPDQDGSEELNTIVIRNIPSAWLADHTDPATGEVGRGAFFSQDGMAAISNAEWDKIDTAIYDDATGELTITFVADELDFAGALRLTPTLYEDYDVNRGEDYSENGDFSSEGTFFPGDLTVEVTTRDQTTLTPGNEQPDDQIASADFDVDVDPVNNIASIDDPEPGDEQEIDNAGGVWTVSLNPVIEDLDGSEEITAIVLRNVPDFMTVYVTDPDNPTGPKIPALITELGVPGPDPTLNYNTWSLEPGQWDDIEIRGIPTHFSGDVAAFIDVVTTETDGGGTRVTNLTDVTLTVDPVTDGGDPSENAATDEDTAVRVPIDGNIIDNLGNSERSPEAIRDQIVLSNIVEDSFGRLPRFFVGDPTDAGTELFPVNGSLVLTIAQAQDLWVMAGQDSNETVTFDVTVTYYETVDPDNVSDDLQVTGTVTVDIRGIADDPDLTAQEDDPREIPASPIDDDGDVNNIYEVDGSYGIDKIYGYAGYAHQEFLLNLRLSDEAIADGFPSTPPADPYNDQAFSDAQELSGTMTEIENGGNFDGSETIYYIIDGVPPGSYLYGPGVQQLDPTSGTYLVAAGNLDDVMFFQNSGVSDPTFIDLTLYGVVYENDQEVIELTGNNIADNMAAIDALPGGAVTQQPFTVIVLPNEGGTPVVCDPVDPPQLTFTPDQAITLEDEGIVLRPTLDPNDPNYDSLADLFGVLPNGHNGSVTIAIDLPAGASISSNPPGAVYLDPTTGNWVIDIAKLGISDDGLTTDGSITITPPPHQSSPDPFPAGETIGPNDPNYDALDEITFTMTVNSVGCPPGTPQPYSFEIEIDPVPDGPIITFTGDDVVKEDETIDLGITLDGAQMDVAGGMDGGERLYGMVTVTVDGGASLFANGVELTPDADGNYSIDPSEVGNLSIAPPANFGGGYITVSVTARTEDVDGDVSDPVTATKQIYVDAVADIPQTLIDPFQIDPDTGAAYIDVSGATPLLQIIEDSPFNVSPAVQVFSPDRDGSEAVSITVDMRDSYAQGLRLGGPSGGGFIDNGDGTYTMSESAFRNVTVYLLPEHARTPDEINAGIPNEFALRLSIQSLETDFINALEDQTDNTAEYVQDFIIRVRPDADVPELTVGASPTAGAEDDPYGIVLSLSGTTPDPHEEMRFDITVPTDGDGNAMGSIFLNGVEIEAVDGVVSIPTSGKGGPGVVLVPTGTVTFVPMDNFAGDISLSVVAISIDSTEAGAIFLDTQASAPQQINLSITPSPDLVFSVDEDEVELTETDAALSFAPAEGFTIEVTDTDGSEVATVTYTLEGVPDGTTWNSGASSGSASGGILTFTGTQAEFDALQITFPRDFATNTDPLTGTIEVTTNEGGTASGSFTVGIEGELDARVSMSENPIIVTNAPGREIVEFGIDASVIPAGNEWETLDEVVIDFSTTLPIGTTAPNGGGLNSARNQLTFSRNGGDAAAFAATIAALTVSIPLNLAEDFTGTVTVTTSHGTAAPVPFEVQFVDAAAAAGARLSLLSTAEAATPEIPERTDAAQPTLRAEGIESAPRTSDLNQGEELDVGDTYPAEQVQARDIEAAPRLQATGAETVQRGSSEGDRIIVDGDTEIGGIETFRLLGGDDLIDLSGAARGFEIWAGRGDDTIIGSEFADVMTGGKGTDLFVFAGPTLTDVITDYAGPGDTARPDEIDLSALVQVEEGDTASEHVTYDAETGHLAVDGTRIAEVHAAGGGLPESVAVIFEDAAGQQHAAVV